MSLLRFALAVTASLFGLAASLPVLVIGLPFWLMAFGVRGLTRLLEPRAVSWEHLIDFDPTFGWRPKANLDTYGFASGPFRVSTDSQGWSGQSSLEESQVVVFGDSFAFGYGVNATALFSEACPRLRVKPIGAPGYNMVQELLWMRELAPRLRGKLVVWFVYINDLYENLQPNMQTYRTPFVRQAAGSDTWEIINDHLSPAKWPYRYDDKLRSRERVEGVFGETFFSDRIYSACEFLIAGGKEVCESAGAHLVVLAIPSKNQFRAGVWNHNGGDPTASQQLDPEAPEQRIGAICRKLGVRFVAAKKHLTLADYLDADEHWNEKGHRRIAELLAALFQEFMSADGTTSATSSRLRTPVVNPGSERTPSDILSAP